MNASITIKNLLCVPEGFRRLSFLIAIIFAAITLFFGFQNIQTSHVNKNDYCEMINHPHFLSCYAECEKISLATTENNLLTCKNSCMESYRDNISYCKDNFTFNQVKSKLVLYPILSGLLAFVLFRISVKTMIWVINGFKEKP